MKAKLLEDAGLSAPKPGGGRGTPTVTPKTTTQAPASAPQASALPDGGGKQIDKATAMKFYEAAGKDPAKAMELAKKNNWKY